ncbi:MAG: serine/threonine protein kinase, partial [Bacillota bacterium]|nr:serine/threonine protein kinase [Bacillota bacterium]
IRQGYVAIDFYDGSILYDAKSARTLICDIDFYIRTPCTNTMGRMWGSSRFMSPEEFMLGAVIDEVTNVYAMGATAFVLLADGNRSPEAWPLGSARYAVVRKAVSEDRNDRQQSIEQLITEWKRAKEEQV